MRKSTTYHLTSRGMFAADTDADAVMTISTSASTSLRQSAWLLRRAADELSARAKAAEPRARLGNGDTE